MVDKRNNRCTSGCNNHNNYNPSHNDNQCVNCKGLMKKLKVIDFALEDTILYLDAYPNCQKALEYYCKLIKEREVLVEAINQKCGPITAYDNVSCTEWKWTKGPWPWEADAN